MDTVVGNKYLNAFSELNIEVSKKLEGEYEAEEIISTFSNFFFNKMFLDITSIKDYKDLTNLQKISMGIDMDKVILLLDKDDAVSKSKPFLAKLVSMGIYNFTDDTNNLMYLYNNPNSYRDVAYFQELDDDNNNSDNNDKGTSTEISHEMPNKKILGIKNITDSAGATTLVYLLSKVMQGYYSTMALELNKRDLTYFNDENTASVKEEEFGNIIDKYSGVELFIVDLDKSKKDDMCDDVLYLIEPSTIKLNKLLLINPNILKELKGKKVILNKCLLSDKDVTNFEVETGIKVYYTIGPLNDKEDVSDKLLPLLEKLGYVKVVENSSENTTKRSIFDLFKGK